MIKNDYKELQVMLKDAFAKVCIGYGQFEDALRQAFAMNDIRAARNVAVLLKCDKNALVLEVPGYEAVLRSLLHNDCNLWFSAEACATLDDQVELLIMATGF